jgi:prolipoprotein diacylglyceryltransferase
MNAGLLALLGALVGGRCAYVMIHPAYYTAHWIDALKIWLGGLSWPGGLAGFWLGLVVAALVNRSSLGEMADGLLPLLPPLLAGIWLGDWLSGVAYGAVAPGVWWGLPAPDEWGQWSARVPLQVAGAAISVGVCVVVEALRARLKRAGQAACLTYLGIILTTLGLVSLRADPVPQWNGWRWDILVAVILSGIMMLLTLAAFWPRRMAAPEGPLEETI